ncbi:hypothetical protein TrVE_jg5830 [Triparma verrucosa]|uniref:Uncharacterized protein n=2 Tax=Triparma TaxID=722752 RepID=A0A9W7E2Q9_9STRA|nr:hypothetical protein TrST_g7690 [Triparma strigata]GMH98508.1 hypothetical protein TrVE_jg5830 [Triparma verrucosa]
MSSLVSKTEDLSVSDDTTTTVSKAASTAASLPVPSPVVEVIQHIVDTSQINPMGDNKIPISLTVFGSSSAHVWIGSPSSPLFGNLVASFPHANKYDSSPLPTTSHLLGGTSTDETLSLQMASRVTIKTGWPVLLSCSYEPDMKDEGGGLALKIVEKEIVRIIEEVKARK